MKRNQFFALFTLAVLVLVYVIVSSLQEAKKRPLQSKDSTTYGRSCVDHVTYLHFGSGSGSTTSIQFDLNGNVVTCGFTKK